jgi:uncharacterized phiE125 gp8 family phage protein
MFETLLVGPTNEPLTVEQLAASSLFDAPPATTGSPAIDNPKYEEIEEQIGAAREHIEWLTNYCYLTQQWRLTLDQFPNLYVGPDNREAHWNVPRPWPFRPDAIELLRYPVQSVESVKYIDGDGNEQTVDPATYDLKGIRIVLKVGKVWPTAARVPDAVSIEYTAGYDPEGSPPLPIPKRLKRALKFLAGWYFENRVPVSDKPTSQVEFTLSNLLTGYRSKYMAR